ncbi:hypothetical protein GCM10025868_13890 [Angustibacter aerolatus]|uniref:Uncharacterized protein n=1 Tax=Angustibacter aerolatus TaxID=1162965 RepID=A0ABQ6JFE7_9ACTN|nr:hypothetical protein GCM10025868_13890 [Angustibacter aerolatus]
MPQHPQQQQRVDVAARQHDDDRCLERVRLLEQAGHPRRTRGLDDELGPLEQEQQRLRERVLGDRHHVVDQGLHQRERHLAGAAHRDAVGHGAHAPDGQRVTGGERGRVRRGLPRLHPDDPDVGSLRLHRRRDARQQSAATGAHHDGAHVRALLEDLEAHRALAGHDVGVVERVDQHRARLGLERAGVHEAVVDRQADLLDPGAVGTGGQQASGWAPRSA